MKRKWRVVTNGEWYELEYRYWCTWWMRYKPHQYDFMGYRPVPDSEFKFETIKESWDKVKQIDRKNQRKRFQPTESSYDFNDLLSTNATPMPKVSGPLQEGTTRSNVKINTKGYTEGPVPPAPQSNNHMDESKGSYIPQSTIVKPNIMTTKTRGMQAATTIRRVTEQKGNERGAKCGYDLFMGLNTGDFHERHESWLNYLDGDDDTQEQRDGVWVPAMSL